MRTHPPLQHVATKRRCQQAEHAKYSWEIFIEDFFGILVKGKPLVLIIFVLVCVRDVCANLWNILFFYPYTVKNWLLERKIL